MSDYRKLIVEQPMFDLQYETVAEQATGDKKVYFTGQYIMVNNPNKNRRIYEEDEMLPAIQTFRENYINTNRAGGELNHSNDPDIKLDKLAHKIIHLERDKRDPNYFIGKSEVITFNPSGRILEGLIKHNMKFGLSTKCLGQVVEDTDRGVNYVKSPIILSVDAVYEPSANSEFINGILESRDYIVGSDGKAHMAYEAFTKNLAKYPSKKREEIDAHILESFTKFLNTIKL